MEDILNEWDQDFFGSPPLLDSAIVQQTERGVNEEFMSLTGSKKFEPLTNYLEVATLERKLSKIVGNKLTRNSPVSSTFPVLSAEVGCPGIIDTDASKSVIGQQKVKRLIRSLPAAVQDSNTVFRFGNSGFAECWGS